MNAKTAVKLLFDLVMTTLLIFLTFDFGTSLFFHETAGIAVYILFAAHLALNSKAVTGLVKTSFKSANKRALLFLVVDVMLLIGMAIVLATGMMISRILFPLRLTDTAVAYTIHKIMSYVCIGVLGFHLALHALYLLKGFKKLVKSVFTAHGKSPARRALAGFAASVGVAAVVYYQAYPVYLESLSVAGTITVPETYTGDTSPSAETEADKSDVTPDDVTSDQASETDHEKKQSQDTSAGTSAAAAQTLNDFLSKMFCTGCHRHCPLLSPSCSTGVAQAQEATAEYEAEYGDR